jgi:hypothetical protein
MIKRNAENCAAGPITRWLGIVGIGWLLLGWSGGVCSAQEPPPADGGSALPVAGDQADVAERFSRLETLLLRSADLEAGENPARAALLQQAVQLSKQAELNRLLADATSRLREGQLSEAIEKQKLSRENLKRLLELLQSENREQRIRDERDEVRRWIEETDRLLRLQSSLRGRTEGGQETQQSADDQGKLSNKAAEISEQLDPGDQADKENASEASDPNDSAPGTPDPAGQTDPPSSDPPSSDPPSSDPPSSDPSEQAQDASDPKSDSAEPSGKQESSEQQSGAQKSGEQKSGEQPSGEQKSGAEKSGEEQSGEQKSGEQKSGEQKSGEQQSGEQQSGEQQQQSGQQQSGQQQSQQSGQSQQQPEPQQPQSPTERAKQRIEQAQQKMQEAEEKLRQAERQGAVEKQREAEEQLRAAIEELEEILRQLREEEIERSLTSLETRLRRMLEMQTKVRDETQRLQEISAAEANRQVQMMANKLGLDERKILAEGERAYLLLRDEGSSAAFPEAIEQANTDIANVAERLTSGDVGPLTVAIEDEIVSSLEEMIEALVQVQKENREKQQQQQQQGSPPPGQPGDQPLIDKLAELRLIRTLQVRINKRTDTLSKMLSDPDDAVGQAAESDIVEQLQELSARQGSIQNVTRDIVVGRGE